MGESDHYAADAYDKQVIYKYIDFRRSHLSIDIIGGIQIHPMVLVWVSSTR